MFSLEREDPVGLSPFLRSDRAGLSRFKTGRTLLKGYFLAFWARLVGGLVGQRSELEADGALLGARSIVRRGPSRSSIQLDKSDKGSFQRLVEAETVTETNESTRTPSGPLRLVCRTSSVASEEIFFPSNLVNQQQKQSDWRPTEQNWP